MLIVAFVTTKPKSISSFVLNPQAVPAQFAAVEVIKVGVVSRKPVRRCAFHCLPLVGVERPS